MATNLRVSFSVDGWNKGLLLKISTSFHAALDTLLWILVDDDVLESTAIKCIQKRQQWANVVEKFREVSITVWVGLKGMIWKNTLKEEWTGKNDSNNNYN